MPQREPEKHVWIYLSSLCDRNPGIHKALCIWFNNYVPKYTPCDCNISPCSKGQITSLNSGSSILFILSLFSLSHFFLPESRLVLTCFTYVNLWLISSFYLDSYSWVLNGFKNLSKTLRALFLKQRG